MRIKKYDFNYGRRMLLQKAAIGASAGVLAPLWPMIANSADGSKAYPDELLSIEMYTKGKIKPGDVVSADNVDVVKDLVDPILYQQIKTMGRKINIVATTKDITKLFPHEWFEATLKNKGTAIIGADGNVWSKTQGNPWNGGNPFPDPKSAVEAMANITLSWSRHSYSQYGIRDWDIGPDGSVGYKDDFGWIELNTTARPDGSIWNGKKDLLRYQSVFFTAPSDVSGTSFLSTWYYDQRKFPDLIGYLPAFKRVRTYPTNQRFEPLVPGITLFLSEAWSSGDPLLTWGNFKIIGRQPMLGAVGPDNFRGGTGAGYNENWEINAHGGPKGQSFFDSWFELCPECIVLEMEPTGYPRAPVGKKRVTIDVRNGMYVASISYDRRGQVWKSFETSFAQYANGKETVMDGKHPGWSWVYVQDHDIQANRMSRLQQVKQINGGLTSEFGADGDAGYNKYLTSQAMQRLGQI